MTTPDALPPDACHLHVTRVDDDAVRARTDHYRSLLTPEERARMERYRFERHRHEYLITRALVRTTLGRYTGVAPERFRFRDGRWGRPETAEPAEATWLSFNLSNTMGVVTCLVAREREIGVDVERIDRGGELLAVADRYFSAAEVAALHGVPEERRIERFFVYWTLKEAYIKARGMGLAIPLGDFSFAVEDEARIAIAFDPKLVDDPRAWRFGTTLLSPEHRVSHALRLRYPDEDVTVRRYDTIP